MRWLLKVRRRIVRVQPGVEDLGSDDELVLREPATGGEAGAPGDGHDDEGDRYRADTVGTEPSADRPRPVALGRDAFRMRLGLSFWH